MKQLTHLNRSTRIAGAVALALTINACSTPVVGPGDSSTSEAGFDGAMEAAVDVPTDTNSCPSNQLTCSGRCVDAQIDPANCGACGNACAAGQACSMGMCVTNCPPGQSNCMGMCRDLQGDRGNCSACGTACASGQVCSMGMCVTSCATGQTDCMGSCRDLSTDRANCGTCGSACAAGQVCSMGMCVVSCGAGLTDCMGTCRDLQSDRGNCGACGTMCPAGQACSMGMCAPTCAMGQTDCMGTCRDLTSDNLNCGACGRACPSGQACSMGMCASTCAMGQTDCMGTCRDLTSDRANCGACGRACAAGQVCSASACVASCGMGLTNCSGSCADTNTSPSNCGACGTACATAPNASPVCVGGGCDFVCRAGFRDCNSVAMDGCELDVRADVNNCGRCGGACPARANASPRCGAGVCSFVCDANFLDCNRVATDGCEANTRTDANNCGACGNVCSGSTNTCENGVCVVGGPAQCLSGTTNATARWVVCRSDAATAWIAHATPGGGSFQALAICQSFGYTRVARWGGTFNSICGYNQSTASCSMPGTPTFDGAGGNPTSGAAIANTVMWECAR
ncbi:MAG: hypothetical protein JNK05_24735 [Myxococcales bacterium]|nr:hypothetical protein [Myxococcales bacterium]